MTLGTLAGCTQIDTPIASPLDLSPPPSAVLGAPGGRAEPVDPRFIGALASYAAAVRALRGARGSADVETYAQIARALRLLADAIAVVPARPALTEPAYRAANDLRVTAALMATRYVTDPRAQTAQARLALQAVAGPLGEIAATDYAGSLDVLAWARRFEGAVQAIGPDDAGHRVSRVIDALAAAEQALEAMVRAAVSGDALGQRALRARARGARS